MHRALVGWMLARAPASPAQGPHHHGPRYFTFLFFLYFTLLLRTLVMGRRQQSESIEAALDMG